MKISKLFHWLYAILMLLPVFAIGVTCAYAIFNKNAYQSYSGNETTQTTYINNGNDFVVNKQYFFNSRNYSDLSNVTTSGNVSRIMFNNLNIINTNITTENIENTRQLAFYKSSSTATSLIMYLYDELGTLVFSGATSTYMLHCSFDFLSNNISNTLFANTNMFYEISNFAGNYIDNVFYYSIDKVQQSPLFNWAYDSFLATPITYITGLFGIANDHISVMLMSYWLAISVIWLVFDMVMYVPLLVHRWIDKGVLE